MLAAEIRKRLPSAGVLSLDARGHGLTSTSSASTTSATGGDAPGGGEGGDGKAEAEDLTLPTLAKDLLAVLALTREAMHWATLPPVLLVGHSLGGAVVTEFASVLLPSLLRSRAASSSTTQAPRGAPPQGQTPTPELGEIVGKDLEIDLLGYAVLDVVEGSAMDALQSMHAYLATRPAGFESVRDGIEWHVRSRTVRNAVSARASVPGLLVYRGVEGSSAAGGAEQNREEAGGEEGAGAVNGIVPSGRGSGRSGGSKPWRWRTDLARTQPFWEGWFAGLSKKFLAGRGGKMLLLAGTDRLDTELTIGQMQGVYSPSWLPSPSPFPFPLSPFPVLFSPFPAPLHPLIWTSTPLSILPSSPHPDPKTPLHL